MLQTQVAGATSAALAAYGSRDDVKEMVARIKAMLPGGDKLNDGQVKSLAQGALAHGLDPFNGEIWYLPGNGLMVGIKGLRKNAHQQVKGNYWLEFRPITDAAERAALQAPDGALVYEARLFDSENILTYVSAVKELSASKIPWEAVSAIMGQKPYTLGYGIFLKSEQTRMKPIQCAMKRAEADALKRRFDVPFGFGLDEENDGYAPPMASDWVEQQHAQHAPLEMEAAQAEPVTQPDNAALDAEVQKADLAAGQKALMEKRAKEAAQRASLFQNE